MPKFASEIESLFKLNRFTIHSKLNGSSALCINAGDELVVFEKKDDDGEGLLLLVVLLLL